MLKRDLLYVLVLASLFIFPQLSAAQIIYGYDVVQVKLKSPVTVREGESSHIYNDVFLVRLRGDFPPHDKTAFEFFIGPNQMVDWGRMKDGVYFKIYREDRLRSLSGMPIMYRSNHSDIVNSGMTFVPEEFTPFKIVSETEAFEPLSRKTNHLGLVFLLLRLLR